MAGMFNRFDDLSVTRKFYKPREFLARSVLALDRCLLARTLAT